MEGTPSHDMNHDELLKLVLQLQKQLALQSKQLERQAKRIAELEAELKELRKKNPTQRLDDAYSVKAEEKRREDAQQDGKSKKKKQKSKRRGRITTAEKLALATQEEDIWPSEYSLEQCTFRYSRVAWRIINGQAVLVAYHIYAGPDGRVPQVPGVPKRGEFGTEIITSLAYQHYIAGLPLDTVIGEFAFYWNLALRKSQADSMLNRLAKDWLPEFDALCQLLAVSAVVYADETSWSINSVWAFLSEQSRITVFGCRKDGETLAVLLKKEEFNGILVSDDAAVYQGFSCAQKCWAHLLRKAIRFTLLQPDNEEYKTFLNGLLDVNRTAKRASADQRLKETGRAARVSELVDAVSALCVSRCSEGDVPVKSDDETDREFDNLVQQVARLMCDCELFTFVLHPEASGTNNEAERSLRPMAQDRRTGRTSKTLRGAQRRTILVSVLESLKLHLADFTLSSVQTELQTWWQTGESLFAQLLRACGLDPPAESRLNNLVPLPTVA